MKMKHIINILQKSAVAVLVIIAFSSCEDWLTIYPQDRIVEENFWTDKRDLEGVRYAAYKQMASCMWNVTVWGDLRADVYYPSKGTVNSTGLRNNFKKIIRGDIDTTNTYFDWSGLYTTINYCNKVLQHGAEVEEKDAQFTPTEWSQMKAEMVALRALNYFILVKAFKNVPYTTEVINTDAQVKYFGQKEADYVLTQCIEDVEANSVGKARSYYSSAADTKGNITNAAVACLLSDMYLWRGSLRQGRALADGGSNDEAIQDYMNCVKYADESLRYLKSQWNNQTQNGTIPAIPNRCEAFVVPGYTDNVDIMYANDVRDAQRGIVSMDAYRYIFTLGNSYEGIFEVHFGKNDSRSNGVVNTFYGYGTDTQLGTNQMGDKHDMRSWFSRWDRIKVGTESNTNGYYCLKWLAATPEITTSISNSEIDMTFDKDLYGTNYSNWILYRLSDALLQKAEAAACLAELGAGGGDWENMARYCCRANARRWYVNVDAPTTQYPATVSDLEITRLLPSDPDFGKAKDALLREVVLAERMKEFVGEGKRWFDLVRYAERMTPQHDGTEGMNDVFDKFFKAGAYINEYEGMRNRCFNLWGMYCPIYYKEIQAYTAAGMQDSITQNPVWNRNKYER